MPRNVVMNEIGLMDTDRRVFVRCWLDKERRCNPECAAFGLKPLEMLTEPGEHFEDLAVMCWKNEIGIMLEQTTSYAERAELEQPADPDSAQKP
jgi:uncharacterized protein (UPF0371 family)